MKEYIERAAVHDLVKRLPEYHMFSYDRTESLIGISPDDVDFGVDEIPAANVVEVRHGRWGEYESFPLTSSLNGHPCSECGMHFSTLAIPVMKYCPNCGARMDKEDNYVRND